MPIAAWEELSTTPVYYVTYNLHLSHCIWSILRLHKALDNGVIPDPILWSFDHTLHCMKMIEESVKSSDMYNVVQQKSFDLSFKSC